MTILEAQTVLLVHAHPDDETLATGALAAELAARGSRVVLLTATRGEQGQVIPGPLSALAGTDELIAHREGELGCAVAVLGIKELHWLGQAHARAAGLSPRVYRDSGMRWIREGLAGPAEDAPQDSLTTASLEEIEADLATLIAHVEPDVVVSYDEGGGYGHPDHVRVHEAALAACRTKGVEFAEIKDQPGDGVEWLDLPQHLETVIRALKCHASQVHVDGSDVIHSGGQREAIRTAVGVRRR